MTPNHGNVWTFWSNVRWYILENRAARREAIQELGPLLERLGPRAFAIAEMIVRRLDEGRQYGDFDQADKRWPKEQCEELADALIYGMAATLPRDPAPNAEDLPPTAIVHGVTCPKVPHGEGTAYCMGRNIHIPRHSAQRDDVVYPSGFYPSFEVPVCGRCHERLDA